MFPRIPKLWTRCWNSFMFRKRFVKCVSQPFGEPHPDRLTDLGSLDRVREREAARDSPRVEEDEQRKRRGRRRRPRSRRGASPCRAPPRGARRERDERGEDGAHRAGCRKRTPPPPPRGRGSAPFPVRRSAGEGAGRERGRESSARAPCTSSRARARSATSRRRATFASAQPVDPKTSRARRYCTTRIAPKTSGTVIHGTPRSHPSARSALFPGGWKPQTLWSAPNMSIQPTPKNSGCGGSGTERCPDGEDAPLASGSSSRRRSPASRGTRPGRSPRRGRHRRRRRGAGGRHPSGARGGERGGGTRSPGAPAPPRTKARERDEQPREKDRSREGRERRASARAGWSLTCWVF